jgi:hypothetical protein
MTGQIKAPPQAQRKDTFADMDDDIPFMQPYHGGLWRAV